MASLITLAALLEPQDLKPALHSPRNITSTDLPQLANLYMEANHGGTTHQDPKKAADRITAILGGSHGTPLPQASLVTADPAGRITAAIITTERALGSDGTKTAHIAELFTHPEHRRQGLAENLLSHAMQALHDAGHKTLTVAVTSSNAAAIALYLSRDFRRVTTSAETD